MQYWFGPADNVMVGAPGFSSCLNSGCFCFLESTFPVHIHYLTVARETDVGFEIDGGRCGPSHSRGSNRICIITPCACNVAARTGAAHLSHCPSYSQFCMARFPDGTVHLQGWRGGLCLDVSGGPNRTRSGRTSVHCWSILDAVVEDQVLFRVVDLFHLTAPSFCACDSAEAAALWYPFYCRASRTVTGKESVPGKHVCVWERKREWARKRERDGQRYIVAVYFFVVLDKGWANLLTSGPQ